MANSIEWAKEQVINSDRDLPPRLAGDQVMIEGAPVGVNQVHGRRGRPNRIGAVIDDSQLFQVNDIGDEEDRDEEEEGMIETNMPVNHEDQRAEPSGVSGGSWYAWWRGDPLPELAPLSGFALDALTDPARITQAIGIDAREVSAWLAAGHRCYAARMGAAMAGYGRSATVRAQIGELGLALTLPEGNHYLWGFETLAAWRGKGVYPHLLQAILCHEAEDAGRFWIGHEPGNLASARGILRAGFQRTGELYVLPGGAMELRAEGPEERARAGAAILGMPLAP